MTTRISRSLAFGALLTVLFCSQACADLFDLRLDGGSWGATTVATGDFNAVSHSPGISNSVAVASISTSQAFRYDNTHLPPTGPFASINGLAITHLVPNQDTAGTWQGRQTALVNGKTHFIETNFTTAPSGDPANTTWSHLAPLGRNGLQTNWYAGIKDGSGDLSRYRWSGGWATEAAVLPRVGGTPNNYAAITYEANAGNYIVLAGDQGLDRVVWYSGAWHAQDLTTTSDYTALAPVNNDRPDPSIWYGTYASGSISGLDRIYYDSDGAFSGSGAGFFTQDINDNFYTELATDMTQPYTLFGLRDGAIDLIQSTDLGLTWNTTPLLYGDFTDIDTNFGVSNALYASGVLPVPEPHSIAIWSILGVCLAGYGYRRRQNS